MIGDGRHSYGLVNYGDEFISRWTMSNVIDRMNEKPGMHF